MYLHHRGEKSSGNLFFPISRALLIYSLKSSRRGQGKTLIKIASHDACCLQYKDRKFHAADTLMTHAHPPDKFQNTFPALHFSVIQQELLRKQRNCKRKLVLVVLKVVAFARGC